jgi:prepilin-type processing-associated H-X9-DG protein
LGVVVVCGGILVALLLPAVQSARQAARQTQCRNNLQQIATAIFEYRQRYHTFPPPYLADQNGRPMHSWRVLILPLLGERALYDRYRFDQPWDSPANRAVAETIPRVYRCPAAPAGCRGETSYVMIVGPRSFSTVTGPRRLGEFPDGAVSTLMLVETLDSGIDWAEPRDFDVGQMSFEINSPQGGGISSGHPGGAYAAMADGSVPFLSEWTAAEEVRAMITIDGGEKTGPD